MYRHRSGRDRSVETPGAREGRGEAAAAAAAAASGLLAALVT